MRRAVMPMALALISLSMTVAACGSGAADTNADKDLQEKTAMEQPDSVQEHIVPYSLAENYFVNNAVKDTIPAKITSKEVFDRYFGTAATMGAGGTPTPIDFDKQYVIAVDHSTTDLKTEIIPEKLLQVGKSIEFHYKVTEGEKMSYSIHPLLILVVDNQYSGDLKLLKTP